MLDADQDGQISPEMIAIEKLSKNMLMFLKPIFEEMDELNASLEFHEFQKAIITLLNDSDPYKRGIFIS
jgi:hypothetical protein